MKFGVFTGACLAAFLAVGTAASAGTLNGTEVAGAKYASSKCKTPEPAGLVIRSIKSGAAFTKAAEAHNLYSAAIADYQKCRVEELNADQNALVAQTKADIEALVALSNAQADELKLKQAEIQKRR